MIGHIARQAKYLACGGCKGLRPLARLLYSFWPGSMNISVLTLTRDRPSHLRNLLQGLARSTRPPDECVVVHMNEPASPVADWPFPCHHHTYQHPDISLPLAQARNLAAKQAKGDLLIFLDVDCIPAKSMIAAYESGAQQVPGITMANVRYLKQPLATYWTESALMSQSQPHPQRQVSPITPLVREPNYGLFWSLSFALRRSHFEQMGGFSDCYRGYGAEDTDFAWKARVRKVPLYWVPSAVAFHQYHGSTVPPWQHFESIVSNAKIFHQRWGEWPMTRWLAAFAQAGYIEWTAADNQIRVIRLPEQAIAS